MQEIIYQAPGSEKALSLGCTCSIIRNKYGHGIFGDWTKHGWGMDGACPVHGWRLNHIFQYDKMTPPSHWQNTPKSGI